MSIVEKAMEKLDRDGARRDRAESSAPPANEQIDAVQAKQGSGQEAGEEAHHDNAPRAGMDSAAMPAEGDDHPLDGPLAGLPVNETPMPAGPLAGLPPQPESAAEPASHRAMAPRGRSSGLRTVADITIDIEHLRAEGLAPPADCVAKFSDEYRRIKRPLLANAFVGGAGAVGNSNMLMVGSSLPGEGKTFTTMNLALSIANELDRTVLLVDADVAKPHISRVLGLGDQPGFIDVLLDEEADLLDVMVSTDIPNLTVLPAGPPHHQSTELLASDRMRRLVTEMSQRYPNRIVIFDSPPLLATTEAQVMAGLMGQILIVVDAGSTPQQAVVEALGTLDPAQSIQLILNKNRALFGDDYYGSYYGYE